MTDVSDLGDMGDPGDVGDLGDMGGGSWKPLTPTPLTPTPPPVPPSPWSVPGGSASAGSAGSDPSDGWTGPGRREGSGRRAGRGGRSGRVGRPGAAEPPVDGPGATDPEPDPEAVARAIALRLLTGAPRSRAQLAEAMARKDVPEAVADKVLDRFTEVGLVDDAEYARILVRSRHADRGLARPALRRELRRKGIAEELAAEALQAVDADQEESTARDLARRRLAATRGLAYEVRVRRVTGMLGRKGYSGGLAHRVVRELLAEEADAGAEGPGRTGPDGPGRVADGRGWEGPVPDDVHDDAASVFADDD